MAGVSNQPVLGKLDSILSIGGAAASGGAAAGGMGALSGILGGAAAANPVGAAVMGGLALAKGIAGVVQQKKADSMMPQAEDPEQRALASYAARRKRAFQTGTAMAGQNNALLSAMKTGIDKSFKVGGGAKGLNLMTQMFNQSQLGMQNAALAGETKFAEMESAQKGEIVQRKLELGLLKYNTEQARAAQQKKESKSMIGLGLSKAIGIGDVNPYGTAGQQSSTTGTDINLATIGSE